MWRKPFFLVLNICFVWNGFFLCTTHTIALAFSYSLSSHKNVYNGPPPPTCSPYWSNGHVSRCGGGGGEYPRHLLRLASSGGGGDNDNKAMAFLRKIGKVGGAANKDFVNAIGVDEGPVGKNTADPGMKNIRKSKSAYKECTISGIIDDLTEPFPYTSSGTQWKGFTDHVMGGKSSGSLTREKVQGRMANVLRGKVSLENNGGFIQMATDLALDPSISNTVDATPYDGIEIDVLFQQESSSSSSSQTFNVHLRNPACSRQFSSYRATFPIDQEGLWTTIRLPWSQFQGYGPGSDVAPFDESTLRRIGIVAIGREMDVFLAVSGIRFYSVL